MTASGGRLPRLGFLGVGWIGRHRMGAIRGSGRATVAAVADASADAVGAALDAAPEARAVADLEALLALDLDGVVIATPSAQHAEQAVRALGAGVAVFCQKPLGRTAAENAAVIDAARRADRLLGVDLSYRHANAMERMRSIVGAGELGRVHAIEAAFHNAYGPDKAWFFDRASSGGGCVIDLGVHMIDLALWCLDFPLVTRVDPALWQRGRRLEPGGPAVEDHAVATIELEDGAVVRLACSWHAHAGRDAEIALTAYGTEGGATFRNVDGSFYDFVLERHSGTRREVLVSPPDAWGGRAAVAWATRLGKSLAFDPEIGRLIVVAQVIDGIYGGS